MQQSALLLPCHFSGLYLLYNLEWYFDERCFCFFFHVSWSNMFIFCALLNLNVQIAAVLLATGGAALSLMNFENSFSNSHQRVGLALYGFMWLQPIIGFFRPERWEKLLSYSTLQILQPFHVSYYKVHTWTWIPSLSISTEVSREGACGSSSTGFSASQFAPLAS